MARVTDITYYQKLEGFIPNAKDYTPQAVGSPTVDNVVIDFLNKYDRELTLNALGVTLHNELETALDNLSGADQKWQDLVEGRDYTIDDIVYRWDGLRGYEKASLVSFYVYSKYLRSDEITYTSTGMLRNESDKALLAIYRNKDVIAWTMFLEQYQGSLYDQYRNYYNVRYASSKRYLTYAESVSLYGSHVFEKSIQASLFQYLNDANTLDPTAFPDFQFKLYPPRNRFGI